MNQVNHTAEEVKSKFEEAYGQDAISRTPEQWRRLVKVYGIESVSVADSMTIEEVVNHCHESYRNYLKRQFQNKRK